MRKETLSRHWTEDELIDFLMADLGWDCTDAKAVSLYHDKLGGITLEVTNTYEEVDNAKDSL